MALANSRQAFLSCTGADRLEFDVLEVDGRLLLAKDIQAAPGALTLREGLHVLASTKMLLSCDIKSFGRE